MTARPRCVYAGHSCATGEANGRSAYSHRDRAGDRPDHPRPRGPRHLADPGLPLPRPRERRRLHWHARGDHRRLRRDHGQGRPPDRLRRRDRIAAPRHRRLQAHGLRARLLGRSQAAALRHGRGHVDDLPLDLRRRAGRPRLARGPLRRPPPRPQGPPAPRRRHRHRHLLRLRLRRARPRRDPDRRPGRRQPRRLALLGPPDRADHRARHHLPLPHAAPLRLLEARDRRGARRGDARGRGPRRRDRPRARRSGSEPRGLGRPHRRAPPDDRLRRLRRPRRRLQRLHRLHRQRQPRAFRRPPRGLPPRPPLDRRRADRHRPLRGLPHQRRDPAHHRRRRLARRGHHRLRHGRPSSAASSPPTSAARSSSASSSPGSSPPSCTSPSARSRSPR